MQRLAIFDFDHTLIKGDSFWPYLTYVAGTFATCMALAEAAFRLGLRAARGEKTADIPSFVKAHLLRRLIAGKTRDALAVAALKLTAWQKPNPPLMRALREHHAQGDKIVIASGGLDLYLPELLRDVPHDALICTDIDIASGIMIHGNCVRLRKAERVGEWLAANGPFGETFGYGNYPHDVPMLSLVKHRIIVS